MLLSVMQSLIGDSLVFCLYGDPIPFDIIYILVRVNDREALTIKRARS